MKKKYILLSLLSICLITSCNKVSNENVRTQNDSKIINIKDKEKSEVKNKLVISNMADKSSIDEVTKVLKLNIDMSSVDTFMKGVLDYNKTVENTTLLNGFKNTAIPSYDVVKLDELWKSRKKDFIGTNCRINTYMLLKNNIDVKIGKIDSELLFLDKESIEIGKIFDDKDTKKFESLFSRVKTESTKDVNVHYNKMKKHFSDINFYKDAEMISVVFHDNIDGDYLFIGHVGVLVKDNKDYLFIEKLSFQEPFQVIKFKDKKLLYAYLLDKYGNEYGQETAKPFIMENNELVAY